MSDENNNSSSSDDKNTGNDDKSGNSNGAGSQENVLADLASERKARQQAQNEFNSLKKQFDDLKATTQTDAEKAIEKARKEGFDEGKKEATTSANSRIVKTEVKRLAADRFRDPSDALDAIDVSQIPVDDNGEPDEKAIEKELDLILKRKPHWAKDGNTSRSGSADQGARGAGTTSASMDDLIRRKAGRS